MPAGLSFHQQLTPRASGDYLHAGRLATDTWTGTRVMNVDRKWVAHQSNMQNTFEIKKVLERAFLLMDLLVIISYTGQQLRSTLEGNSRFGWGIHPSDPHQKDRVLQL